MLNRSSECAIAAMSLLAEIWGEDRERLTATQVAERRRLTKPFVAKVLTILSQVGLVKGAPGPHGGYCLGPRFLVMAIPFLLLPAAVKMAEALERQPRRALRGRDRDRPAHR